MSVRSPRQAREAASMARAALACCLERETSLAVFLRFILDHLLWPAMCRIVIWGVCG